MARLYRRKATVIVGSRLISNLDGDGLRIQFRVVRALSPEANTAEATIYNLREENRGTLVANQKQPFTIEAGYIDTAAQLFSGTSTRVSSAREDLGFATKVEASDGKEANRKRVSISHAPGAPTQVVLKSLVEKMGANVSRSLARIVRGDFNGGIAAFTEGLTISGNGRDELDKFAKAHNFEWSIEDGELIMLLPGETTNDGAVFLSPSTGLIGSPVRIFDDEKKDTTEPNEAFTTPRKFIIRAVSMLQPKLKPGRQTVIESVDIKGQFRVLQVTHSGDTHGSEWSSEIEAERIST